MDFYLTAVLQALCFSGMVLGIYISMKIFNIPDITTDGSYTLGGAVSGVMLSHSLPVYAILPIVLLAGALSGTITGIIHTKLKVNALLAGILVMTALYSVNLVLMGRSNLPLLNFANLYTQIMLVADLNHNTFLILIIFVSILAYLIAYLLKTDFGIAMRATGNSEMMVRAMGVNTDSMKITGLAIANALTATSGFLMVQFQGFADISMGIGIVIVGLGSVILGEAIAALLNLKSVWLCLAAIISGAIIFQLILATALTFGIDPVFLKLVIALFVLLIVTIPQLSFKNKH